jgi:glycosyltransferase involved in cell wall biosynthesis
MILPSLYEGFGMPYAEALLTGRQVIACDIPIAREVLGDAATFIQPPFGPDEIIAAIQKFLREGERLPSREAVEKLEARTLRRNVAERYLELIRGVADA